MYVVFHVLMDLQPQGSGQLHMIRHLALPTVLAITSHDITREKILPVSCNFDGVGGRKYALHVESRAFHSFHHASPCKNYKHTCTG